jgi:hypothetical protein
MPGQGEYHEYLSDEEYIESRVRYRHTHVSKEDGSPAMLVSASRFVLMNESGDKWFDDPEYWEEL